MVTQKYDPFTKLGLPVTSCYKISSLLPHFLTITATYTTHKLLRTLPHQWQSQNKTHAITLRKFQVLSLLRLECILLIKPNTVPDSISQVSLVIFQITLKIYARLINSKITNNKDPFYTHYIHINIYIIICTISKWNITYPQGWYLPTGLRHEQRRCKQPVEVWRLGWRNQWRCHPPVADPVV